MHIFTGKCTRIAVYGGELVALQMNLQEMLIFLASTSTCQRATGSTADRTCFFQLTRPKMPPWSPETAGSCKDSDPVLTHSSRRW